MQIPVRVLREIHGRRLVTRGLVVHDQLIARREGVGEARDQRPRESFLSILARIAQRDARAAVGLELLAGPFDLVESAYATMQRVRPIVVREVVRRALEGELTVRDAIGVAADDRAEVRRVLDVAGETVEAED